MRSVKDGWYAMDRFRHLASGPYSSREDCLKWIGWRADRDLEGLARPPEVHAGKCRSKSQPHAAKLKKGWQAQSNSCASRLMKVLICALPGRFAGTRYGAASRYSGEYA